LGTWSKNRSKKVFFYSRGSFEGNFTCFLKKKYNFNFQSISTIFSKIIFANKGVHLLQYHYIFIQGKTARKINVYRKWKKLHCFKTTVLYESHGRPSNCGHLVAIVTVLKPVLCQNSMGLVGPERIFHQDPVN
jgi:hypothetical protein